VVRTDRTAGFKQRFRGADVVLIDDVQFLAGRDRTREEFFHTFNSLLDAGRQLVMTSDRAPEDIPGIEERLIERFRAGLVAEVETPEVGVRMAILAKRARLDGVDVSPDVIYEIATRVATSVRALEGALIRVVAYASMNERDPTPELVRHVLRRLKADETPDARSMNEIVEATAQEFGLEPAQLRGKGRQQSVSVARQVAMYLAKELTQHSPSEIGEAIGGRDRKTVTHGITRATEALQSDQVVRTSVNNLRRRLAQPA
jgi:chromosomal replication initiator protein